MKKTLLIIILGVFTLMAFGIDAYAAKKASKSKVPQEEIQAMSDTNQAVVFIKRPTRAYKP